MRPIFDDQVTRHKIAQGMSCTTNEQQNKTKDEETAEHLTCKPELLNMPYRAAEHAVYSC